MNKSLEQFKIKSLFSKVTGTSTWDAILVDINNDIIQSGRPLDSIQLLKNVRKATLISAIFIFPLSIFLMTQLSPIFVTINLIWIVLFAFPKIQQSNISQERKKKVEEEIPSFVIFASVMQDIGMGLYDSFQLLRETKIFQAIDHEALLLKRNVEFFGLSQMESLEEIGRTHRSEPFRNLLLGYTSIWRSGGDLSLYLENRAEEFFTELKQKYQTYSNNVGTVVEILVTLLIILPIMIMVVSFVLPGSSLEQITLLSVIGLPLFAVLLGIITTSIQPRSFNQISLGQNSLIALAVFGLATSIIIYLFNGKLWLAISLGVILPSIASAIIVGRRYNEINKLEGALIQFLRDMTEYKKIGYDVILAINRLSEQNPYNSIFNKKLNEIKVLLDHGVVPTKSVKAVEFRSWFTKISFYLLAYIAEYGGGNPRTLETINRFIGNAKQSIKEGRSTVSALTIIVFATPLIMGFTAAMIMDIIGSFEPTLFANLDQEANSQFGLGQNFINLITVSPEFLEIIKVLIVVSSLLSAFVITKGIDFSFFNTWRVVAIGIIAVGTVVMVENFQSLNFDTMFEAISFG